MCGWEVTTAGTAARTFGCPADGQCRRSIIPYGWRRIGITGTTDMCSSRAAGDSFTRYIANAVRVASRPLPDAITTNCLPATWYVIGVDVVRRPTGMLHSSRPFDSSKA